MRRAAFGSSPALRTTRPRSAAATGASPFWARLCEESMSLHKLQTEREARDEIVPGVNVALNLEVHDIAGTIARARAMRAVDFATRNLPVHRLERWSARRKVAE